MSFICYCFYAIPPNCIRKTLESPFSIVSETIPYFSLMRSLSLCS